MRRSAADPALGAVQVVFGERGANRELEQRGSTRDQVAQRGVTGLLPQLARVHAVGGDGDEGLSGHVLLALERLERRGVAGRVAVEHVDELTAKEACRPSCSRRSIARWSSPNAVPHEATAVVTPARCIAITSV